jgi:D-alanyl-D-alanine carboxypeptidase/D-alanyl-D-alanine-endopeptidase (penicillin-binding protein 4)
VADPSLETATTFAAQLRARGVRVLGAPTAGTAPAGATALASVESAPVAQLVDQLLQVSANETAEVLLRQVGVATSGTGSTAAGLAGVREVLSSRDVPLPVRQRDGSGLSRDNLVPPATLAGILQAVAGSADDDPARALVPGLPVAGFSGSLALRFDDVPDAAVGRVRAKTGTLRGVRSLAGVVVARDGTPMVFALMADRITGDQDEVAEAALDRAAAALAACRCGRS